MYKLVAIDLDGTLLNSYGQVSEKNKQAISLFILIFVYTKLKTFQ